MDKIRTFFKGTAFAAIFAAAMLSSLYLVIRPALGMSRLLRNQAQGQVSNGAPQIDGNSESKEAGIQSDIRTSAQVSSKTEIKIQTGGSGVSSSGQWSPGERELEGEIEDD